jgi:putative endonuclease
MAIVERRFRCRFGEVDLVAFHADAVVFVEVKARRATGYGLPAEAVTPTKQRRLARVALFWLARHRATERPVRFDVVEVVGDPDQGGFRTRHIRDAFRPSPTVLSGGRPVGVRY